jgi:hypothetical protein
MGKYHNQKAQKKYNQKIRFDVLQTYSGKYPQCACCGESKIEFLGINHINGKGNLHRKELTKQGTTLYLWLKKNNYPVGFNVLCHNCNLSMGYYGYCPHKKANGIKY